MTLHGLIAIMHLPSGAGMHNWLQTARVVPQELTRGGRGRVCVCVVWPFTSKESLVCLLQDLTRWLLPWFLEYRHCLYAAALLMCRHSISSGNLVVYLTHSLIWLMGWAVSQSVSHKHGLLFW